MAKLLQNLQDKSVMITYGASNVTRILKEIPFWSRYEIHRSSSGKVGQTYTDHN